MHRINVFALCLGLIASAGCASTPASPDRGLAQSVQAGGTTFVQLPTGHGPPRVVAFGGPGKAVCPECSLAARKYFDTGKLPEGRCATCGARMVANHGQWVN